MSPANFSAWDGGTGSRSSASGRAPPDLLLHRGEVDRLLLALGVGVELLDDRDAEVLEPDPGHEGEHRAGEEHDLVLVASGGELLDRPGPCGEDG